MSECVIRFGLQITYVAVNFCAHSAVEMDFDCMLQIYPMLHFAVIVARVLSDTSPEQPTNHTNNKTLAGHEHDDHSGHGHHTRTLLYPFTLLLVGCVFALLPSKVQIILLVRFIYLIWCHFLCGIILKIFFFHPCIGDLPISFPSQHSSHAP